VSCASGWVHYAGSRDADLPIDSFEITARNGHDLSGVVPRDRDRAVKALIGIVAG
jgi:hypothetical protein